MMKRSTDKVIHITDFNFQSVLDEMNIRRKQHHIIRPLKNLFDQMINELRPTTLNRKTLLHAAAQVTIEKASFIVDMLDTYADDFLGNDRIKRDALYAAAIIGEDVETNARRPSIREFSPKLVADIQFLNQECADIRNGVDGDFHRHSLLLAHLHYIRYLDDAIINISEFDENDIRALLEDELPLIEKIVDASTDIGQKLIDYITDVEQAALDRSLELEQESGAEYSPLSIPNGAEIIAFPELPFKINPDAGGVIDPVYMTEFNEVAIYDSLSIDESEEPIRAAARFIYAGLKEEFSLHTLADRKRALQATIDTMETPYYLSRNMAGDFIRDEYNHDALEIAAICEQQSYVLGQNGLIDKETASLAELFAAEAVTMGLTGSYDQIENVPSQFLSHVFAVKQVNDALREIAEYEDEEEIVKLFRDIQIMRRFIRTDKDIGLEFMHVLDRLHLIVAPHEFWGPSVIEQAKLLLSGKKSYADVSFKALAQQTFYANDI